MTHRCRVCDSVLDDDTLYRHWLHRVCSDECLARIVAIALNPPWKQQQNSSDETSGATL